MIGNGSKGGNGARNVIASWPDAVAVLPMNGEIRRTAAGQRHSTKNAVMRTTQIPVGSLNCHICAVVRYTTNSN